MRYLKFIFLESLVFSCTNQHAPDKNQDVKSEGPYIDIPFVQEYHEGYLVDEKNSGGILC